MKIKLFFLVTFLAMGGSLFAQGTQNVKGTYGAGPPQSSVVPGDVGSQFVDTTTGNLWVCTAINLNSPPAGGSSNGTGIPACTWTLVSTASTPVSVTAINVTAPPFNAANNARFAVPGAGTGCISTAGLATVHCNAPFFHTDGSDIGLNFAMWQSNAGGGPTYYQSTTVLSVQGKQDATMVANNTASSGTAATSSTIIGKDAAAAIRAATAAMTNQQSQVYFPCGIYYVSDYFLDASAATGVTAPFGPGWVGESGGGTATQSGCVVFVWPKDSPYTKAGSGFLLASLSAGGSYLENVIFDGLGQQITNSVSVGSITGPGTHTTNVTLRNINYSAATTVMWTHSADNTTETNLTLSAGSGQGASGLLHNSARTVYINPIITAAGINSIGFKTQEWNAHIFGGQISSSGTGSNALQVDASGFGSAVTTNTRVYGTCFAGTGFAIDATSAGAGIPSIDLFSVGLNACQTSGVVGPGGGIRIGTATNIVRCSGCWFSVQSAVNGLTTVSGAHFFDLGGNTYAGTNSIAAGTIHGATSITGTPQTSGNWSVPAGAGAGQWGTSPSVGSCSGFSRLQLCTITVGSGTVGTNPVLTVTHPTLIGSTNTGTSALAGFLTAPICRAQQVGGTQAIGNYSTTSSTATTASFTAATTPAASATIILEIECDLP